MNIAQILCAGSFAGSEAVACGLARALQSRADRSVLYVVQEVRAGRESCAQLVQRAREFDVELRLFETEQRFSRKLLAQLHDALSGDAIDIVHNHSYKTAFLCPMLRSIGCMRELRVFFTIHGFDQSTLKGAASLHTYNALGAYLCDGLVCVSGPLADHYRRMPLLGPRTNVIPNSIASAEHDLQQLLQQRPAARRRLAQQLQLAELDPEAQWVGVIGRLVPVKNHQLFIEAAAAVQQRQPQVRFLIVGGGPLEQQLRQEVQRRGVQQTVSFTGQVEQIDEVYRAMDLMMLTSHSEGSPMVVLEAMSFGVPTVASRVGGVPDLIHHDHNGLLFDAGDLQQCVHQLQRLLADDQLRLDLGQTAHEMSRTVFSPAQWADNHLKLYEAALA